MNNDTKEKIQQLQLIEQNIQNFLAQKQQLQGQLLEIENSLRELDNTDTSYKIIGSIMIKKDASELKEELEENKKKAELRINSIEEQEKKLKEKAEKMQSEVMKEIESNKEE